MKRHYVYQLRNTLNGMMYIGVRSCNCSPTDDVRYMGSSRHVKRAIEETGPTVFEKIVLAEFENRADAVACEVYLHEKLKVDTDDRYYNRAKQKTTGFDTHGLVGEKNHFYGKKHSDATRKKLSEKLKGKPSPWKGKVHSLATRQALRLANLGKKASDDTKAKMRASHIGLFAGSKHPMFGKHHGDKSRARCSAALIGRTKTDVTRAKMRAATSGNKHPFYGQTHSDESRERIRQGLLRRVPAIYSTPAGEFHTAAAAARAVGCSKATVIRRCRTPVSGWSIRTVPANTLDSTVCIADA